MTEATLDNGLRVLVLEDHRNPIATVQIWYRVGSRNERPGATGLAHFLEHMMFKGTPTYGKGQFARLVEENGGQDNAFTSHDVTSYYVNIAADRVDLVLGLEADRMRNLLLDPKEIDSERQVVAEERRTRTEDDPDGYLSEEISRRRLQGASLRLAGHRVDGATSSASIRRELRAFYDRYYLPNNALLVVAGDVDTRRVLAARARDVRPDLRAAPRRRPWTAVEPPQLGERRVGCTSRTRALPIVYIGYHVPNYTSQGRARARAAVDHPAGGARLAAVPAARLRAAAGPQRRGRLRLSLARPQSLLVLGHAAAGADAGGARAGHHGRDRAREERAHTRRGAGARQEPDRGRFRLAAGLDLLAGGEPGPLRADGLVAEQRDLRSADPPGDRGRSAARGADVLPESQAAPSGPCCPALRPPPRASERDAIPVEPGDCWSSSPSRPCPWPPHGRVVTLGGGASTPVSRHRYHRGDPGGRERQDHRPHRGASRQGGGQGLARAAPGAPRRLRAGGGREAAGRGAALGPGDPPRSSEGCATPGDRGCPRRRVERRSHAQHDRARIPAHRAALPAKPHRRPGRGPRAPGLRSRQGAGAKRPGEAGPRAGGLPPRSDRCGALAGDPGGVRAGPGAEPAPRDQGRLAHRRRGAPEEPRGRRDGQSRRADPDARQPEGRMAPGLCAGDGGGTAQGRRYGHAPRGRLSQPRLHREAHRDRLGGRVHARAMSRPRRSG